MSFNAWLVAVLTFALSTAFSPGPNNIMLLSSGSAFGIRRTLPHLLGVATGFPFMTLAIGLLLGEVFLAYPLLHTLLKVFGIGYMLYLAGKIALSRVAVERREAARPLTFFEAALFQWVNPKAWVMALGAMAAFTNPLAGSATVQTMWIAAMFLVASVGSSSTWAVAGSVIAGWLHTPRRVMIFNIAIALSLVLSIIPMMAE